MQYLFFASARREGCSTNGWPNQNQLRLLFRLITLSTFACVQIGIKKAVSPAQCSNSKLKLANKIRETDIEATTTGLILLNREILNVSLTLFAVYIRRIYTMTPKTSITRRRIKKTFLPHEIRWWPRRPRRGWQSSWPRLLPCRNWPFQALKMTKNENKHVTNEIT